MTPLAMRVMRRMMTWRDKAAAKGLAQAPCFDVTAVSSLIEQTAQELRSTTTGIGSDDPVMEHGGLLFTPSEFTWIEQKGEGGRRFGSLLNSVDDQIAYMTFNDELEMVVMGLMELKPDGEHFSVHLDSRGAVDEAAHRRSAISGGWSASALLLINAPRGVERTTTHAHKGLARDVRRELGISELQPVHTIRLSLTAGLVGDGAGEGGSSKMFHFCRSHARRLPDGRITRVRAHWRGDPSLGIGQAVYRVTP